MRVLCAFLTVLLTTGAAGAAGLTPAQESALRAVARGEAPQWTEMDEAQARALHEKAEAYLDNLRLRHMPHGFPVNVLWTDETRSQAAEYTGLGDSACWHGHYLAALALKYSATGDEATREALLKALDGLDLLTRVSGREGYVARYAGPANDEAYRAHYRLYGQGEDFDREGLGRKAYRGDPPRDHLVWLGDSSRDTYDGAAFGLAAVLAYAEEPEAQSRARALVRRIGKRLLEDDWNISDGQGDRTRPAVSWQLAWMRLLMTADPEQFGRLGMEYTALYEKLMDRAESIRLVDKYSDAYSPNNLDFDRFFVLCALEKDAKRAKAYRELLRRVYAQAADHLNAQFAGLYLLCSGDEHNANARATLQGMLLDFPDPPNQSRAVDNRDNPAVEMLDGGTAKHSLLSRERPPTDFMWQHSPCRAVGGEDTPLDFPGIDVFLPYWMGRVSGAIPKADSRP